MKKLIAVLLALASSSAAWANASPEEAAKLYTQSLKGGSLNLLVRSLGSRKISPTEQAQWAVYLQESKDSLKPFEVEQVLRTKSEAKHATMLVVLKQSNGLRRSFAVETLKDPQGNWYVSFEHH